MTGWVEAGIDKRLISSVFVELHYYSSFLGLGIIRHKIFVLWVNQEARENHFGGFYYDRSN